MPHLLAKSLALPPNKLVPKLEKNTVHSCRLTEIFEFPSTLASLRYRLHRQIPFQGKYWATTARIRQLQALTGNQGMRIFMQNLNILDLGSFPFTCALLDVD